MSMIHITGYPKIVLEKSQKVTYIFLTIVPFQKVLFRQKTTWNFYMNPHTQKTALKLRVA